MTKRIHRGPPKPRTGLGWGDWDEEVMLPGDAADIIKKINWELYDNETKRYPNPLYPERDLTGMPLPEDTTVYTIHNLVFQVLITQLVAERAQRKTNCHCLLALGHVEWSNGYAALVGDGLGKVAYCVGRDHHNLSRLALYKVQPGNALAWGAVLFDEHGEAKWIEDTIAAVYSPPPSRSREWRRETKGTGYGGGWGHSTHKDDAKDKRPDLRTLDRKYAGLPVVPGSDG